MVKREIRYFIEVEKRRWEIDIPVFFMFLFITSVIAVLASAITEMGIISLANQSMQVRGLTVLAFWLTLALGFTLILLKEEGTKIKKKILVKQENLRRGDTI